MEPRIFLSHAAADAELVDAFEELLSKATGIVSAQIFCSTLEGQGVKKGSDFVARIRDKVRGADAVIALITPAYLESAFCMAELGAAWVLGTHRFPVIVPPVGFDAIDATQLGLTGVKVDQETQLSQMLEDLNEALNVRPPKDGVRRRALARFGKAWPELSEKLTKPRHIALNVHAKLEKKCEELGRQVSEADERIDQLEEINAKLTSLKDAEAVARVHEEYEDTDLEEEFSLLVDAVIDLRADLGGPAVLMHAIMDNYGRAGAIDWDNDEREFDTAVQHGVYDPEAQCLVWSCEDLTRLEQALANLSSFLEENEGATFLTRADARGVADARFWENRL